MAFALSAQPGAVFFTGQHSYPSHSSGHTIPLHIRQGASCVSSRLVCCSAAPAAAPPTSILKLQPEVYERGGLPLDREAPADKAQLAEMLSQAFCPLNLDYPGLTLVNIDPPIFTITNFLDSAACDAITAAALSTNQLRQSEIGEYGDGTPPPVEIRTSSTLVLTQSMLSSPQDTWRSVRQLLEGAQKLIQLPLNGGFTVPTRPGQISWEVPQVARYSPGQHFLTHEDAFPPKVALSKGRQRRATLLVYLNDVTEGGETKFDIIDIAIKPEKGKALLFFPAFSGGRPDSRTRHAAQQAVAEKWIFQLWISSGIAQPKSAAPQLPQSAKSNSKKKKRK